MFRHLQSFELLLNILISYKDSNHIAVPFINRLGKYLDDLYHSLDFQKLIENKLASYENNSAGSEYLFSNHNNPDLHYINLDILNTKEKIFIYINISGWINNFPLKDEILKDSQKIMSIKNDEIQSIDLFFDNKTNSSLNNSDNFFTIGPKSNIESELEGIWVDTHRPKQNIELNHLVFEQLESNYKILYVSCLKAFILKSLAFKKSNNGSIEFNDWEIIEPGKRLLNSTQIIPDYSVLKNELFKRKFAEPTSLQVNALSFEYANRKGIKKFNLDIACGSLIGILGKQGTGKTTLLKVLAGELTSYKGEIRINGYDQKKDLYHIKSLIGYVSEDDLLCEELTVYENLYYTAKLYLGRISDIEIRLRIDYLLKDIGMDQYKDFVVGSFNEKRLLPGQRRLLNIAMELLREPQVLIIDDALEPLNVNDSSKIIEILSDYTYKGNIVITSITQCTNEINTLFDNFLILDEGGFPIYYGKIESAYRYFNNLLGIQCDKGCIVRPEKIISLFNTNTANNQARPERYLSAFSLYEKFREINEPPLIDLKKVFPGNKIHTPTLDKQFTIFSLQNIKNKISRSRDLAYTLLFSPVLATVLSLFLKEKSGNEYYFSNNDNIPVFLFLSVIIVVFIGLVQSANEILRERKLNKKREYLNLSRFSYINSKISYLFVIALFQTFLFVLISHKILKFQSFLLWHWIVLFSAQAFAIIIGLIFSDTHKRVETIYLKSIPLIIFLQLIFGGCLFDLNNMYPNPKTPTPYVSDLIVARWGYEALMVQQFKENEYEKNFFNLDRNISQSMFYAHQLMPAISAQLKFAQNNYLTRPDTCNLLLRSVKKTLSNLPLFSDIFPYENITQLNSKDFNDEISSDAADYIEYVNISMFSLFENALNSKDSLEKKLQNRRIQNYLYNLKKENFNYAVAGIVTDTDVPDQFIYIEGRPVQLSNPVYQYPTNNFGREIMFLPEKKFNNEIISTFEFNISMIWLLNVLIYIILLTDLVNKIKNTFYRLN